VPSRKQTVFKVKPPDSVWHIRCSDGLPTVLIFSRVGGSMLSRERVESVLERIRPLMQADGGDIELVNVSGNSARVRLTGMCSGCPSAHMTLYMGVEMALREEIKEFEELQVV